jgi:RimJ/RimL family protein N-acetyltransferase
VSWLRAKLADRADCRIWIAEVDGVAVGQARVDRKAEHVGEISVALAPEARGRGLAAPLIRSATEQAHGELGLERIEARIKPENARSLAAFRRAGYERVRSDDDAVVLAALPNGDGRD